MRLVALREGVSPLEGLDIAARLSYGLKGGWQHDGRDSRRCDEEAKRLGEVEVEGGRKEERRREGGGRGEVEVCVEGREVDGGKKIQRGPDAKAKRV
jgi:hypothetical protein